jgi:hypothetical protein
LSLEEGARKLARRPAREKGKAVLDPFVYTAYARKGWMVPNQYWTPGALSPMPIMGKYCMYCGNEFMPPRKLGRINAQRFRDELIMDNLGLAGSIAMGRGAPPGSSAPVRTKTRSRSPSSRRINSGTRPSSGSRTAPPITFTPPAAPARGGRKWIRTSIDDRFEKDKTDIP